MLSSHPKCKELLQRGQPRNGRIEQFHFEIALTNGSVNSVRAYEEWVKFTCTVTFEWSVLKVICSSEAL